jgi:hypothetical protein
VAGNPARILRTIQSSPEVQDVHAR